MKKRDYIPFPQRLAASLAKDLPEEQEASLRAQKVEPEVVIGLFDFDHIVLRVHGGSDEWHNLNPMLRRAHIIKTKQDLKIIAKVRRIERKYYGDPAPEPTPTKRKIPARINPWPPRGSRKIRARVKNSWQV